MKTVLHSIFFSASVVLTACESSPLSVSNEVWECKREDKKRTCLVKFTVSNSSHFPVNANIRIGAHKRSSILGSDAITNKVIYEKTLNNLVNSNDQLKFEESFVVYQRPTNIVVSAWGDEV